VRTPLPPVASVLSFIDAINQGDVARLAALMTTDHRLRVLDEGRSTDGRQRQRVALLRDRFPRLRDLPAIASSPGRPM